MADRVYLTRVETTIDGDSYFPILGQDWKMISEESMPKDPKHAYPFHFQVWEKTNAS